MTLRHIAAAEVRHQQREREREREKEREREIKREAEREKKKPEPTERARKIGIFSMIGFDSSISCFLALLINIPYRRKLKKGQIKNKIFIFAVKKTYKLCQVEEIPDSSLILEAREN